MGFINSVIIIIFGLLICFLGKKYSKMILGFQSGLVTFYIAGPIILMSGQPSLIALIGGLVLGVGIGLLVARFLYTWKFIIFGVLLGIAIVGLIEASFGIEGMIVPLLASIAAILGGILGSRFTGMIVELSSSISGAAFTVVGGMALSPSISIGMSSADATTVATASSDGSLGLAIIIGTLALAGVGFVFQYPTDL